MLIHSAGSNEKQFLQTLQKEAKWQSALQEERFIPKNLGPFANFFLKYSWQILLGLALFTAIFIELISNYSGFDFI